MCFFKFSCNVCAQTSTSRLMYVHVCMFLCVPMQVKMLVQSENGKLRAALVANLKSAVTASFLMLPESFSEEDLFLQIAGLSYAGNISWSTTIKKT